MGIMSSHDRTTCQVCQTIGHGLDIMLGGEPVSRRGSMPELESWIEQDQQWMQEHCRCCPSCRRCCYFSSPEGCKAKLLSRSLFNPKPIPTWTSDPPFQVLRIFALVTNLYFSYYRYQQVFSQLAKGRSLVMDIDYFDFQVSEEGPPGGQATIPQ